MVSKYEAVKDLLLKSKSTYVLTGAGVSTDSGIPDFRSADTGIWTKIDPMEALSTNVLNNKPEKFYEIGFELLKSMRNKKPNRIHEILATLESKGLIDGIITQNIDNLHTVAGSKNVFEVHGETRTCYCEKCKEVYDFEYLETEVEAKNIPPKCKKCGCVVRPSVIMFGDMLPDSFTEAQNLVSKADLLIVIGTSLTVSPVNYMAAMAKKLIIINKTPTPFDYRTEVLINEDGITALEKIMEQF